MLSVTERAQVIKVLQCSGNWNFFPIQVDTEHWELRPGAGTRWRTLCCSVFYGLFVANTGYKVSSLLYAILFIRDTPLHQMMIHGIAAVAFLMITFWYYVLFVKHADVHAKVFRMTLTGNIGEGTKGKFKGSYLWLFGH